MRRLLLVCMLVAFVDLAGGSAALARSSVTNTSSKGVVVLTKLSDPVYPMIARTAHIAGDVVLDLEIREDGSVESDVVVSGPPLLQRAALASAQESRFKCNDCGAGLTSFRLFYTFQLIDSNCCVEHEGKTTDTGAPATYPQITSSQNHVRIVDKAPCICDPGIVVSIRVRSLKCLFLWRCGYRS